MKWFYSLLGIEEKITISSREKLSWSYAAIALCLVLLVLLVAISGGYFFYLLTSSYLFSVIGGVVFSLIVFFIYRFALLSITPEINIEVSFLKLLFNTSNILRLPLVFFFIGAFLVPLITAFKHEKLTQEVQKKREILIEKHRKSNENYLNSRLTVFIRDIDKRKQHVQELESVMDTLVDDQDKALVEFKISREKDRLVEDSLLYQTAKTQLISKISSDQSSYQTKISSTEFPIFRCMNAMMISDSRTHLILLTSFFTLILVFYMRTISKTSCYYSRALRDYSKNIVDVDYEDSIESSKEFLNGAFNYVVKNQQIYQDPPYNSIKVKSSMIERKDIDLFNEFN